MPDFLGSYSFDTKELKNKCQSISSGDGHMLHNVVIHLVNGQGMKNGMMSAHISSHFLDGQHHYHGHFHYHLKRDNIRGMFPVVGAVKDPLNVIPDAVKNGKIVIPKRLNNIQELNSNDSGLGPRQSLVDGSIQAYKVVADGASTGFHRVASHVHPS